MRNLPNPQIISFQRFVPLVILLGLSGCGGGGSGGGVPPPPVNQPPVANNSCAYATGVNQLFNGNLSATDPEGQPFSFEVVTNPANGTLSYNSTNGAFTYTPYSNTRGADTFTFRACEASPSTVCSSPATYKIVHTPRIMPLGDSITEGVNEAGTTGCSGVCPPSNERISYRKDLRDALAADGYTVDFVGTQVSGTSLMSDDQHEGHGGWTAYQLVNGNNNPLAGTGSNAAEGGFLSNWLSGKMDNAATPDPTNAGWPDVILLHIGTNDLSPGGDQSSLWTNVQAVRNAIVSWSTANSWPVTLIYSRINNSYLPSSEFTNFNDNVINGLTPTIWVDQEVALLNVPTFYGDTIHPSDLGYQEMANYWLFPLAGIGTDSGNNLGYGILPKCP